MVFKKICTRVDYLAKADGSNWLECTAYLVGRHPKSKIKAIGFGAIQSISYPKCNVEIPDEVVNQCAAVTETTEN